MDLSTQIRGCRFVPYTVLETKPQTVPRDLNIGFAGFGGLIQGQIYNLEIIFFNVIVLDQDL